MRFKQTFLALQTCLLLLIIRRVYCSSDLFRRYRRNTSIRVLFRSCVRNKKLLYVNQLILKPVAQKVKSYRFVNKFNNDLQRSIRHKRDPVVETFNSDPRQDPIYYNSDTGSPLDELSAYIEANLPQTKENQYNRSNEGNATLADYVPSNPGERDDEQDEIVEDRFEVIRQHSEEPVYQFQSNDWSGGGGLGVRKFHSSSSETFDPILEIEDLHTEAIEDGQKILNGINIKIMEGETHCILGRNGSGKSTLTKVIAGHPNYKVTKGSVKFKGMDLLKMPVDIRSVVGVFLAFQYPVEIEMVKNSEFLRIALNERRKYLNLPEIGPLEFQMLMHEQLSKVGLTADFLQRPVNYGFSGGEKKRNEILQMLILQPCFCMLDETDSGLDVDSFRLTASAVKQYGFFQSDLSPSIQLEDRSNYDRNFFPEEIDTTSDPASVNPMDRTKSVGVGSYLSELEKRQRRSFLIVTHYKKLVEFLNPQFVHVMHSGRIVRSGRIDVADILDGEGFTQFDVSATDEEISTF